MEKYQKVEDVKEILEVGKTYLVPCIIKEKEVKRVIDVDYKLFEEEDLWRDEVDYSQRDLALRYIVKYIPSRISPIINHPHNDVENGQPIPHYHADDRFKIEDTNNYVQYRIDVGDSIEYLPLKCIRTTIDSPTGVHGTYKAKIKHNCIHKGKCPHRGMDLSQVPEIDGVITCPLHSLKFNAKTKQIIT
jgi:hypothetical protein